MSKRNLNLFALYYLFVPFAIFLCAWTKPFIGVPIVAVAALMPMIVCREIKGKAIRGVSRQELIVAAVIVAWVVMAGIGGYVWQNRWDHLFRNAVFIDMVNLDWPVQHGDSLLTYYIGFWLPAAALAKLSGNIEVGWLCQLLYGILGVWLAFRLTVEKIGNFRLRYLLPFILFSGLDIVYYLYSRQSLPDDFLIEQWNKLSFWGSNTTLINWVYNQAIPSWVATMLLLNFGKVRGIPALTLCFLSISAPFSVVGLAPLALYYVVRTAVEGPSTAFKLKRLLNAPNIIAAIGVVPVALYFSLNRSTNITFGIANLPIDIWLWQLAMLLLLEILVFVPFIFKQIRKSPEFYILLATCLACLFIQMKGRYGDFNSRVELPLNYFMTLQICIFIKNWSRLKRMVRVAFLAVSLLAVVTPALETARVAGMTLIKPREKFRSHLYDTIFDIDAEYFRINFIADSVDFDNWKINVFRFVGPDNNTPQP